jgi:two-component system, cell cycle sensor histidine kinase and response regulator CckA
MHGCMDVCMMDHVQFSLPPSLARTRFGSVTSLLSQSAGDSAVLEPPAKELPLPDYAAGTETILFVEDMEPLLQVIAASLEQLGYRVISAASGEEALALTAEYEDEIDLLLTDVVMPQMKGPELAQKLAANRPRIKVIYVSGYPKGVLAPYGVLEPGTILLHKPFSIKILAAKLREVLDQ